ncbi:ScyD/ScyE family protein [Parafrigoribacterium mesophilum]|uniref:ScyD/ScyE family protein n=1 Tax=Parafrigoribacterium mesophilum TaxID=433646 RepID=UPI0031FDDEFE
MKKPLITAAVCASLLASVAVAAPASAHNRSGPPPWTAGTPVTVTTGLVSPLSLDVARNGFSYLSQNFAGLVTQVDHRGTASVIASAPGFETGAVSSRNGTVYYAVVAQDHSSAALMARSSNGTVRQVADLWAHENSENPDSVNAYGFEGLSEDCIAQFPAPGPMENPPAYTGIVDTHPYASLALADAIYVADAGANAIWRVGYDGTVTTVAVLPPTAPTFVTAELASAFGFPACAAGHNYRFEPVPTDVELGPNGWLYVTSLPGGPEDASLGARGAVLKVNPHTGKIATVATGFTGSTGLAVSPRTGTVYVAELFGGPDGTGQVSVVWPGANTPTPLIALSAPAAIELRHGTLYVTTDALTDGKLTLVPLSRSGHSEDDGN